MHNHNNFYKNQQIFNCKASNNSNNDLCTVSSLRNGKKFTLLASTGIFSFKIVVTWKFK